MAVYWNKITKEQVTTSPHLAAGNSNLVLIKSKSDIDLTSQIPAIDVKYITHNEAGFPIEMTAEEKAVVDVADLASYKNLVNSRINAKTGTIVELGYFVFDGEMFSISTTSQTNWNTIYMARTMFTFPKEISTRNGGYYNLALDNVDAFWLLAKNTIDANLAAGRELRKLVNQATTKAQVDAVVDAR